MKSDLFQIVFLSVFSIFSIPILIIDIRSRRIPDILSLGGCATILAFLALVSPQSLLPNTLTAFFAAALFYCVRHFTRGLGLGDVKLAGFIAFFLGPVGSLFAFPISATAGLLYALYTVGIRKTSTKERIPYAPFLIGGAYAGYVAVWLGMDRVLFW